MSKYFGDFLSDQIVSFEFNTRDVDGAPITLADTPAAAVFELGSATPITTGVTLTIDVDDDQEPTPDPIIGTHRVTIDTAAAGLTAGKDYVVRLTAGTVDSVSVVGTVLGSFSIENRNCGTISASTLAAIVNGIFDEALAGHTDAGSFGKSMADTEAAVEALPTVGDIADAVLDEDITEHPTEDSVGAALAAAQAAPEAGVIADAVWDEDITEHDTPDSAGEAQIGAATDASGAREDTEDIQSRIPDALDSGNIKASVKAIDADAVDANAVADDAAAKIADSVLDEDVTAHTGPDSVGAVLAEAASDAAGTRADTEDIQARLPDELTGAGNLKADVLAIDGSETAAANLSVGLDTEVQGQAVTGTLSTTQCTTDLTETNVDQFVDRRLYWIDGVLEGQQTVITAYDPNDNGKLTFRELTDAPSNGDKFIII